MKSIVITGADGFIGSHLVKAFAASGYEVYAVTVKESTTRFRIENLEHVHVLIEDINQFETIGSLPDHPTAFIHLAWAGVSPEGRKSMGIQQSNIDLTLNAVRLAARIHAGKFIFPGSTAEYWNTSGPINKNSLPSPSGAYGAAKISCRYLAGALCEELNVPFVYVVITGIYASDRRDSNVIFYTINSLLKNEKPSYTALEQKWDYVYIDDVVQAFLKIADKGRAGAFYTVGHGDNIPLSSYILKIRDEIDPELELGIGEIPYSTDVLPSSCVDLSSLIEDCGYQPEVCFEDGIRRVIAEVKKNM